MIITDFVIFMCVYFLKKASNCNPSQCSPFPGLAPAVRAHFSPPTRPPLEFRPKVRSRGFWEREAGSGGGAAAGQWGLVSYVGKLRWTPLASTRAPCGVSNLPGASEG